MLVPIGEAPLGASRKEILKAKSEIGVHSSTHLRI